METRVISAEENKVTVCGEYSKMFMALEDVLLREGATFTIWDQQATDLEVQIKDKFRILINVQVLDFCLWVFTFREDSLEATDASPVAVNKAKELASKFCAQIN